MRLGEITAVDVTPSSEMDIDQCLNWWDCTFPAGQALDTTRRVRWSDGDRGGEFGWLDGNGNLVPTNDWNAVTHYKAPEDETKAGVITISLKIDDEGKAIDPATGQEVTTYNDPEGEGTAKLTAWEFTITDNGGLQGWRPERDSTLHFTATIRPATDHKDPPNSMARIITFSLSSLGGYPWSSQEPGYCLNATREHDPPQWDDTYPDDNDLKFPPDQADFIVFADLWDENQLNFSNAETVDEVLTETVTLRCLDYGARGWIDAFADLPGEPMAVAKLEGTLPQEGKYGMKIPIDEAFIGPNDVADSFDISHGPLPADYDAENFPATGDNATHDNFTGDGYTYFEEYRGIEVNGVWTVLDTAGKDIFVFDRDNLGTPGARSRYGGSNLTVYWSTRASEMGAGNVVNFFRKSHTLGPQCGLRLLNASNDPNDCGPNVNNRWGYAFRKDGQATNGRPGEMDRITVCVTTIQNQLTNFNHDQQTIQDAIDDTVAHELAHGSFVWHHGDNQGAWFPHASGNAAHPGNNPADLYDGDLCIMRAMWPPQNFVIPSAYCNTMCVMFPMPNHLQCRYHFDVRDASRP